MNYFKIFLSAFAIKEHASTSQPEVALSLALAPLVSEPETMPARAAKPLLFAKTYEKFLLYFAHD